MLLVAYSVKAMGNFLNGAVVIVALFLLQIIFASGSFSDVLLANYSFTPR
jgi:hypothetical protein